MLKRFNILQYDEKYFYNDKLQLRYPSYYCYINI